MADTLPPLSAADRLFELVRRLETDAAFADVLAALRARDAATLDGVWGSSCALAAAALAEHCPATLLIVLPRADDVEDFRDDLALFSPRTPDEFPAWDTPPEFGAAVDDTFGRRLRTLKRLSGVPVQRVVLTSIQAVLQTVPPPQALQGTARRLAEGDALELDALRRWLVEAGFEPTTACELPGEFAVRGGILDLFAPEADNPVRVELWGDEIASLRSFDVATQRSLGRLEAVEVTPLTVRAAGRSHLAAYLAPESWVLLVEPEEVEAEGRAWLERLETPERCHTVRTTLQELLKFSSITASGLAGGSLDTNYHLRVESIERFSGEINRVRQELDAAAGSHEVHVVCQTDAEARRLTDLFAGTEVANRGQLHFPLGRMRAGFRFVPAQTVLISSGELFCRADRAAASSRRLSRAIDSFVDLREGDLVVHVGHGVARYLGLKLTERSGQEEEHLELEFQGGTRLYVPASRIGLVQKYVGGSKARPTLARIGGKSWARAKESAGESVVDLALEMLDLQAARASQPGIRFPLDTEWQTEFDASFPYNETPDQITAIAAIKDDMHRPRPMDRLLCGDVGYGKTEVAMRAAFKALDSGYQVAVLVPTTILAEQHFRTFTGRMAEFPFSIASLSRFRTRGEQQRILASLVDGSLDLVIGTHRLAQKDVQFGNLGLVIIDEEQRFGVDVKERLKALRHTVDVLTLTATPIPRTLHMSLVGMRDISNLETPPEERLAVATKVTRFQADLIRQAALRELNRGGQIYFVHNRIQDIEVLATRIKQIVPEARVRIGHGQMAEHELEEVMLGFVAHEFDLLLATTIVENGLDIPRANTIFIDQADRYGLADLHQLRGRVGRYKHRAYCYLLVDPGVSLSPASARRLRAIEEFSDMGAGFALAMRDLEIRGAGNILGTQQSGHIAAVGYELYCQLLEQAVRRLQKLPVARLVDVDVALPGQAFLPRAYVPDLRQKIDLYRRLSRVAGESELDELRQELLDRFGPPPPAAVRLLDIMQLRLWAQRWSVSVIRLEPGYVVFEYRSRGRIDELVRHSRGKLRVADGSSAYLPISAPPPDAVKLLAIVQSLLRPAAT